jgi:hypothetical protein
VTGTTLADVQEAIDNHTRINLQSGVTYEGDTTVTLSDGSGPNGQRTFVDARGAVLNYTGDGKRCVEILPVGAVEGIPGPDRNAGDGTREARNYTWLGGTIEGPGPDVTDSAAIYAEDMFGCDITVRGVGSAEHGVWVRNKHYWSESNSITLRGRRSARGVETTGEGLSKWAVRLDGGPASDDLNGTLSYRTSDVSIDWIGPAEGYLWLNGASMHGGTIQLRGFLGETADGLRITNGGWNRAAMAHVEWEGGSDESRPVYIGPNSEPPLFISPRIGHPDRGHFANPEDTFVNESSRPALCLKHHGLYADYTDKLLGVSKDGDGQITTSLSEFKLDGDDLTQTTGSADRVLKRHDGSGDAAGGMYTWLEHNGVWRSVSGDEWIEPSS